MSVALVPLTVAPFVGGSLNPVLDATFCGLLVIHSHIGFEYASAQVPLLIYMLTASRSCIIDYFPKYRVPKTRAACMWLLRIATVATGVALYEFETNDVGITEAVKRVWTA